MDLLRRDVDEARARLAGVRMALSGASTGNTTA